jgi:hypothetical protein
MQPIRTVLMVAMMLLSAIALLLAQTVGPNGSPAMAAFVNPLVNILVATTKTFGFNFFFFFLFRKIV